jgi:hypothetical protein
MNITTTLYLINILTNIDIIFTIMFWISIILLVINIIWWRVFIADNCYYDDWAKDMYKLIRIKNFMLCNKILIIIFLSSILPWAFIPDKTTMYSMLFFSKAPAIQQAISNKYGNRLDNITDLFLKKLENNLTSNTKVNNEN